MAQVIVSLIIGDELDLHPSSSRKAWLGLSVPPLK